MINTAGKFAFVLTFIGFALAIAYGLAVGDRAGTLLLVALGIASIALGLALSGSGALDRAPWADPDSPIADVPVGRSAATLPSWWPLALAVAGTVGIVGLAVGAAMIYVGIILVLAAAMGWLLQAWREHPRWTPTADSRFRDRVLVPIGLPLGALVLILIIVVSVSRVLLAVNEKVAVAFAAVCAGGILAAFAFLSSRPHTGRNLLAVLGGITLVAVAGAGVAGAAKGPREFENKVEKPVAITAKNTQFNKTQIELAANKNAQVLFRNEDNGTYHNVSIWTQPQGGSELQAGPPIVGIDKKLYTFSNLQPGTYAFRCDFHVNMVGTLVVK